MLIPGQNRLAKPEIVETPKFEDLLARFKQTVVDAIAEDDPDLAAEVEAALANEAEVATKLVEAATVILQTQTRHYNEQIQQMLAWWAKDSNLDAKVADLGLERQLLDPGDPDANPPVPPTYESDDRLRLRYFLAPHAPAAGSRLHYRNEALTLSDRALVSVDAPEAGVVTVTYRFDRDSWPAQIKDANGRRVEPGRVRVTVLARDGDGTPSAELLDAVRAHFARPDVSPETDDIEVVAAEILPWSISGVAYIHPGPDATLTQQTAVDALQAYADEQHVLGGSVEPSWVYAKLHEAGAVSIDLASPLAGIAADDHQAPWCESIDIEVRTL